MAKDQPVFQPIRNEDLDCKDCQFTLPPRTDICTKFPQCKPLKILKGEKCQLWEKRRMG